MADVTITLECVKQSQLRRRVIAAPVLWGSSHVTCPLCREEVELQVQGPMVSIVKAVLLAFFGVIWIWTFCSWYVNWWYALSEPLSLTDYGKLLQFFILGPTVGVFLVGKCLMLCFERLPSAITHEQNHRVRSCEVTDWPDQS